MAWDIMLDTNGDLVWSANLDVSPVVGDAILRQRISTRLKVPVGSFIYDNDLGSRLTSIIQMGVPSTDQNISGLVRDALATMADIIVLGVDVQRLDNGRTIQVTVNYQPSNEAGAYLPTTAPEAQTTVLFPG